MIGHFPSPHPDESLYSLCARFSERVRYRDSKAILQELFGARSATAVFCLPNRLNYLAGALPAGTSLTVDRLIEQHTILPFFSAFFPPELVNNIRKDMESGNGAAAYMRCGIAASRIKLPDSLRFCSACKRDDEAHFGETYWHRVHQLPGIETCVLHGSVLQSSNASIKLGRQHLLFVSASDATNSIRNEPAHLAGPDAGVRERLARDAAWLLDNPTFGTASNVLHNRYLHLLIKQDLATYTGSIHVTGLLDEFKRFYSQGLLSQLQCDFSGRDQLKTNWLLRLVRYPKHSHHPLYHLLLIHFLGCTAQDFFQLRQQLQFFGNGPWPCLNQAAGHFRQPVIQRHILSKRSRNNRPIGNFHCECGFAYARSGPDTSPDDRFRIGKMISFGPVWEAKLTEAWNDGANPNLSQIGRGLGVDPLTVRRHVHRLELPFPAAKEKRTELGSHAKLKDRGSAEDERLKRNSFRSRWVKAINRRNWTTMSTMRKTLPRVYAWLVQNDRRWLKRNQPTPAKRQKKTLHVNWKTRDSGCCALVKQSADGIRNLARPVRITRTAIGRKLGLVSLFQKHLDKLPLTRQMLASVVEDSEQFSIRRIQWAAHCYLLEGLVPQPWQLILRANAYKSRRTPGVENAIQSALNMLHSEKVFTSLATA